MSLHKHYLADRERMLGEWWTLHKVEGMPSQFACAITPHRSQQEADRLFDVITSWKSNKAGEIYVVDPKGRVVRSWCRYAHAQA